MIHLGDISKIDGSKIEPVDVITFGSPCQDLSVAGKRKGLGGERSGLFMEAVRIIKEMREATNGVYPNYAIWENVPGAFSSNGGRDFATVLEELCRLCDPRARVNLPDKKWRKADYFCDGEWSIAYRVFDAQFWGVAQRRRRIALVVDFRGNTAPEILFERQGLRRNITPSPKARKEAAGDIGEGVEGGNVKCLTPWLSQTSRIYDADGVWPCLSANEGGGQNRAAVCYGIGGYNSAGMMSDNPNAGFYEANTSRTLDCNGGNPACNQGGIAVVCANVSPTLQSSGAGTERAGGHERTELDYYICQQTTAHAPTVISASMTIDCRNIAVNPELSGTIQAKNNGGQSLNYINPVVTSYENSRHSEYKEGCGALRASGGDCGGGGENLLVQQTTGALCANSHPGSYTGQDAFNDMLIPQNMCVRRLTPLECERLQGYPDYWTDVPSIQGPYKPEVMEFWRNIFNTWSEIADIKPKTDKQIKKWLARPAGDASDGARYKSLGNSIALPPWKWVLKRISAQFEREATLGSLFDGIGGFPLIWEQINGRGSARWASEIEPFPIRVTWTRFCKL